MNAFDQFMKRHWDGSSLLLGLSGGPDSLLLFYLLLEREIPFQVAHIDHGWRSESAEEARKIALLCDQYCVPIHVKVLNSSGLRGNLEDVSRDERRIFFKELCAEGGFQATLLGHHADDQAETVLKRVFEGATLPRLRGLAPVAVIEGATLWRPLLSVKKQVILAELHVRGKTPFEDPTNHDPRFLRSRLRDDLLPLLAASFGKEISSSLCRLGEYGKELSDFLEEWLVPYRARMQEGRLDLTIDPPETLFGWKAVVRDFLHHEGATPSHSTMEVVVAHLQERRRQKVTVIGKRRFLCDSGVLSLLKENPI